MKILLISVPLCILFLCIFPCIPSSHTGTVLAQNRAIGANKLNLDDGNGHTITIMLPPGLTGSYNYSLPLVPGTSSVTGYVGAGSSVGQTLFWNGSYWAASNYFYNTGSGISLIGTFNSNGSSGTSGQVLEINGAGIPVWANVGGTGTVTSVDISGGTTGLTTSGGPINGSGTITLDGILAISNGGTGGITRSDALNNLLPPQGGNNGLVLMTNGTTVGWAATSGIGTVTSVGLSAPSEFIVSNSPITGAGVLTMTSVSESANTVWAGPISGGTATPSFRSLVSADIPDNAANTTGNAATATTAQNFSGSLAGEVTGMQGATVVSSVGGSPAAAIHSAEITANAATDANSASAVVKRDASGNFSAGMITANLNGNATTATSAATATAAGTATNFSGTLAGDVTGTQSSTEVTSVAGSSAINIHSAELATNAATDANDASTIVKRNASGNFSAGTITANLNGNAATATSATTAGTATTAETATNFSGSLAGDVTGSQGLTIVSSVGSSSAANVHAAEMAANAATDANDASTIVKRDASGNFSAGTITANLSGDVNGTSTNVTGTVAIANGGTGAISSSGALKNLLPSQSGNNGKVLVTDGTNASWQTVSGSGSVSSVGLAMPSEWTVSNSPITSSGTLTVSKATQSANTIYAGPSSGGNAVPAFRTLISADIPDNAANTSGNATNFTGTLSGEVIGTQTSTEVSSIDGSSAANVHSAELAANAATDANDASTIVKRNASGDFSAGTITADLNGNAATATSATTAGTATNFSGTLAGDVTGTQSSTVVTSIGGSTAANIHSAELAANAATNANSSSTVVKRDAFGNFSAGTITASLNGNASSATTAETATTAGTATNFSGSLAGDVTGTQGSTVVTNVGGSTAANVHSAELAVNASTSSNTASTIVKRDASGNFSCGTITASLNGNAATSTSATTAETATNFSGTLAGDVTGMQSSTSVASVGGSTAANIHTAELAANAATNTSTASAIVKRDASGNFSAGTITANLTGNVSGTASNVTGTVAASNGGTGITTYSSGDLLYASGSTALAKLSVASNPDGYVLTLSGGLPSWQAASGGGGSGWGLTGNSLAGTEVLGSTNAQPLVIETNGSERLRVLSGGNVGIGTSAPNQLLEIKNGNLLLSNSGTAKQLQLQGTGSGVTTFTAGGQGSTNINYTLPTAQPTANQVLAASSVSGSGPYSVSLGWASASSGPLFAYKSSYQDYTYTYLVNDNDLAISLAANATYIFDGFLAFKDQSGNSTDVKIAFTVPASSTIKYGWLTMPGGYENTTVVNGSGTASQQIGIWNGSSSYESFVYVKGIVFTSSTSGNLQLQCERVGGTTLRLQANSYITATRVN